MEFISRTASESIWEWSLKEFIDSTYTIVYSIIYIIPIIIYYFTKRKSKFAKMRVIV
jgi:cbb3-type cytochrome oxidase subunit 3